METVLIAVGALLPMLLVLVAVHEFGHYATAKALGVKALEFGFGFPPRAFGFYTGNTTVVIDSLTRFVNVDGPGGLVPGQVVTVYSDEDASGNLVARIIDGAGPGQGLRGNDSDEDFLEQLSIPAGLLKHDGKVKAVEAGGGSLVLADMLYSVNWLPLGGFVRLAGENDPTVPRSLAGKGPGTRFIVLVSGSLMNAILPIIVFAILFMVPRDVTVGTIVVAEVSPGSAAAAAGVRPGDAILEADGKTIENRFDLQRAVFLNGGSEMDWLVQREGARQVVPVEPRFERPPGRWVVGVGVGESQGEVVLREVARDSPADIAGLQPEDVVLQAGGRAVNRAEDLTSAIQTSEDSMMEWLVARNGRELPVQVTPRFQQGGSPTWYTGVSTVVADPRIESRSQPIWEAIPQGFVSTWESLVLIKQGIFGAVSQGSAPELSGPIGIAQVTGEVTRDGGFIGWLTIAVLLSINLAVLNLLPIPMLDGGRLVFVVLEWLRRGKRVPAEKEGLVHLIGLALLVSAIVVISAGDINRLIQGGSVLGG